MYLVHKSLYFLSVIRLPHRSGSPFYLLKNDAYYFFKCHKKYENSSQSFPLGAGLQDKNFQSIFICHNKNCMRGQAWSQRVEAGDAWMKTEDCKAQMWSFSLRAVLGLWGPRVVSSLTAETAGLVPKRGQAWLWRFWKWKLTTTYPFHLIFQQLLAQLFATGGPVMKA